MLVASAARAANSDVTLLRYGFSLAIGFPCLSTARAFSKGAIPPDKGSWSHGSATLVLAIGDGRKCPRRPTFSSRRRGAVMARSVSRNSNSSSHSGSSTRDLADLARAGYEILRKSDPRVDFVVHHAADRPGYLRDTLFGHYDTAFLRQADPVKWPPWSSRPWCQQLMVSVWFSETHAFFPVALKSGLGAAGGGRAQQQ